MTITSSRCRVALIILSMTSFAFPGDTPARDGYWWAGNNQSFKQGYVWGYVSATDDAYGKDLAHCLVLVDMMKDKYPGQDLYEKMCLEPGKGSDFDGITGRSASFASS